MKRMWARLRDEDAGASLVEYALLLALIAMVCIAAVTFLGTSLDAKYDETGSCFANAGSGSC